MKNRAGVLAAMTILGWLLLEVRLYAYLDPGSGSMLLQILLGGFAAVGVVVRLYWNRLTGRLGLKRDNAD